MRHLRFILWTMFILCMILAIPLSASAQSAGNEDKAVAVDTLVSSGGEAVYRILIKNDDTRPHKYTLSYGFLPKGYQTNFTLDGKVIKELDINAQDSVIAILNVTTPLAAEAGTTIMSVEAKREDGQSYLLPVSVTVNRDYSLLITSRINGLNVINGQSLSIDIPVSNNGSKALNNIGLKLDLPYKWMLQSTNPEKLSLKPGENGLMKVKIAIPPSQVAGNNKIKVSAVSDSITSPQIEIPVTVQSNPSYLIWVMGLISAVGIGTLLYFRKHGRR